MKTYTAVLFGILFSACIASASERGFPDAQTEAEIQELFKKVKPAYVFVAGGSGAVISKEGLIITNHHVVGNGKKFDIRLGDGRSFHADVIGIDPRGDLALLKIRKPENLPVLPLGNSDRVRLGQFCIAIGNPFGMGVVDQQPTVSFGVISGTHVYQGNYSDAIVTDAPINPGNSGGPLINMKGELIGVNGQIRPRWGLRSNTGLGYAIPANQIRMWIPLLEKAKGGAVFHGRLLGLTFENNEESGSNLAVIQAVREKSDAEKAGFKPGDQIISVNGKPVWNAYRFASIIGTFPAGVEIGVTVQRGKGRSQLKFRLAELRPGKFGFKLGKMTQKDKLLLIGQVEKGSAAEKAGLKKGDRIAAVMGQRMSGPIVQQYVNFARWAQNQLPTFELKLTVLRGKKEIEIVYELE